MTDKQVVTTSPHLSIAWRTVTGVAAVAGLAAGGIAVFRTNNGAGSAALLAVGLYFAIVAAMGRFPKFRIAGEEIDPSVIAVAAHEGAGRVADAAAETVLDKKPPEEVARAARRAAEGFRPSLWMPPAGQTDTTGHVRQAPPPGPE